MKKLVMLIAILVALVGAFFLGRTYTLETLEILDNHHVVSMGEVHVYD
jgi:hypothetical protein